MKSQKSLICYTCEPSYIDTTVFPPSLWAQVPSDAHRTNNGPESFHRHFSAQFTSTHPTFFIFWDALVKQQTVSYVIRNDLNTLAPVTTVEQKRRLRLFRAWNKFQEQRILRQQFLRELGFSYAAVPHL